MSDRRPTIEKPALREAIRLSYIAAVLWAANVLSSGLLLVYLARSLGATGLQVSLLQAAPALVGLLRLFTPALILRFGSASAFACRRASSHTGAFRPWCRSPSASAGRRRWRRCSGCFAFTNSWNRLRPSPCGPGLATLYRGDCAADTSDAVTSCSFACSCRCFRRAVGPSMARSVSFPSSPACRMPSPWPSAPCCCWCRSCRWLICLPCGVESPRRRSAMPAILSTCGRTAVRQGLAAAVALRLLVLLFQRPVDRKISFPRLCSVWNWGQ